MRIFPGLLKWLELAIDAELNALDCTERNRLGTTRKIAATIDNKRIRFMLGYFLVAVIMVPTR
jgi:hypothetical protein